MDSCHAPHHIAVFHLTHRGQKDGLESRQTEPVRMIMRPLKVIRGEMTGLSRSIRFVDEIGDIKVVASGDSHDE